jgi:hypothetical protein
MKRFRRQSLAAGMKLPMDLPEVFLIHVGVDLGREVRMAKTPAPPRSAPPSRRAAKVSQGCGVTRFRISARFACCFTTPQIPTVRAAALSR